MSAHGDTKPAPTSTTTTSMHAPSPRQMEGTTAKGESERSSVKREIVSRT